jgi:hypothetical protein
LICRDAVAIVRKHFADALGDFATI